MAKDKPGKGIAIAPPRSGDKGGIAVFRMRAVLRHPNCVFHLGCGSSKVNP
jgi:hypothetical protein